MIALGWCHAEHDIPDPLTMVGSGPVGVISAHLNSCPTARDRLRLLQTVFDAGIDCIPLAADRIWPLSPALALSTEAASDVLDQLAQIEGSGQLTIAAQWNSTTLPNPKAASGREWLLALSARNTAQDARTKAAEQLISTLIAGIVVPKTVLMPTGDSCALHLLLDRKALGDVLSRVMKTAQSIAAPDDITVSVTGLWPPLNFVHSPRCMAEFPT